MIKKYWLRLLAVSGIAIILALSIVLPCSAITSQGATISLNSVNAYENVVSQGDLLFVTDYTAYYPTTPTEPISSTFILRLIGTNNASIADALPFPFFNNGYTNTPNVSSGEVAIYLTPTQVVSLFGSLSNAWSTGKAGAYYLVFIGNPTATWTGGGSIPTSSQHGSAGFNWKGSTSTATTSTIISGDILAEASNLTGAWNNTNYVLSTPIGTGFGFLLTTTGQDYFTSVLPSLSTIAPTILTSPANAPVNMITTPVVTTPYSSLIGNDFLGSALDLTAGASALKIGAMWLGLILSFGIIALVAMFAVKKANSYKPLILVSLPMLYAFIRIGWAPMLLGIGFGLIAGIAIWYVIFEEKTIA